MPSPANILKFSPYRQIRDLEEQLRDVMFFLEAKSKIDKQPEELREELQEATVVVPGASGARARSRKKK